MIILSFVIGLLGVGLVSFGAWLIYQPAGLIVCGALCLIWSFLIAASNARVIAPEAKGDS